MDSNSDGFDKQLAHRVNISRSFSVGKTEVTQTQWRAVRGSSVVEWVEDSYHNSYAGAPIDGRAMARDACFAAAYSLTIRRTRARPVATRTGRRTATSPSVFVLPGCCLERES